MVLREARHAIGSFEKDLGKDRIDDIASQFLLDKLDALVEADNPQAFLATALYRRAVSLLRRKDAQVVELTDLHADRTAGTDGRKPLLDLELEEARLALNSLSRRDRELILAVASGHDPEEVAREFRTSRANAYQIISRFRRRFKREEP